MHDENLYAERALRAGARGYVMKQEAPVTVLKAIRQVLSGKLYLSDNITSRLIKDLLSGQTAEKGRPGVDRLSDRELEIFELIGNGESTREIAQQLNLSVKTIETHRAHIRQKLKLQTPRSFIDKIPDQAATMAWKSIPDDEKLAWNVMHKVREELDDLGTSHSSGKQPKVKGPPRDARYCRKSLPVEVELKYRSLSSGRPGSTTMV